MDWPILVIGLDGQRDSELLELLSSKGWALESVASVQQAQHRASLAEYLAIVVQVGQAVGPEEVHGAAEEESEEMDLSIPTTKQLTEQKKETIAKIKEALKVL